MRLNLDENSANIMGGQSSSDADTILPIKIDPTTGRLLTSTVTTTSTPSTIYNGSTDVTTAGTAVALGSSTTIKSVVVKAKYANTGTIYIGDASVSSSNGIELQAGDAIGIDIDDLSTVYIDASVNGEGVNYLATI